MPLLRLAPLLGAAILLTPARDARGQSFGDEGPPPTALRTPPEPSGAETSGPTAPARTPLAVLDGVVRSVDLTGHSVLVEVAGATVRLGLDRNTLVYLPAGLSTVVALRAGDRVRAGRNDKGLAYWIEVQKAPGAPAPVTSKPGQGTGPAGGSPAPPEGSASVRPPGSTGMPR